MAKSTPAGSNHLSYTYMLERIGDLFHGSRKTLTAQFLRRISLLDINFFLHNAERNLLLMTLIKKGELRGKTLAFLLLLEVIVTVALGTSLLALPYLQKSIETEPINLKDIVENPDDYLGERNITLTLTRIELREDPYHRLTEQYYLAYVRDDEGYERSFVISEKDKPSYRESVGSKGIFELGGSIGPHLIHPPDRLITNILLSVRADSYSREYYTISIRLIEPTKSWLSQLNITLTYLTAASTAATALTSIAFLAKRRRKLDPPWRVANKPLLPGGEVLYREISETFDLGGNP